MPAYLRPRIFRRWDWSTPRAIWHLPRQEQERLKHEVRDSIRRQSRRPLLLSTLAFLILFSTPLLAILPESFWLVRLILQLLIFLIFFVLATVAILWDQKIFRKALQQKLID